MLNFEEEMKAVKKGYVVLDIDEYNRMRDEIAAANMKAYEAEQLANRRIAEAAANNKAITDSLLTVEKKTYGKQDIEIVFNRAMLYALAVEKLHETFGDEDLDGYRVVRANELILCDETIATRSPISIEERILRGDTIATRSTTNIEE